MGVVLSGCRQCRVAQEVVTEPSYTSSHSPCLLGQERGAVGAGQEAKAQRWEDELIDDDEDQRRRRAAQAGRRRSAVSTEAINPESMRDYVKPVYEKDQATKDRIAEVIRNSPKLQVLFGHLGAPTLLDVVNAFEDVTGAEGEEIIRQGDEGDCLYIIASGSVDVFVQRPGRDGEPPAGGRGAKVTSLGAGDLFGELALLYSAPRAATVVIMSPRCQLWRLHREPFKMLLAQQTQAKYELYEGWLSEVSILRTLNAYELSRLSEAMESTLYDDDEVIVRQGEEGDRFFILEDGTCAAFIEENGQEVMVKEYTSKGDYFGEIALLKKEPRRATVRASAGGACVVSISKEDFTNLLGPIQDVLEQDIDKYVTPDRVG